MELEARFTPIGMEYEIPFTIIENGNDICLYSKYENKEYRYDLSISNNTLLITDDGQAIFKESQILIDERLMGLYSNWIEQRSQGFENEYSDEDLTINKPGYGPDDIFVENKPFSLKQIIDLIKSKDIDLSPDFQRNFIWDKTRQSRLIESIFLGLPLPSIYLSQYDDGILTIVDGLQRLSTIREFMDDSLVLSNLEYLKDCNGKKYSELDTVLSPLRIRRFGQTQIMCFVIDYRSPSKLKFDLFRRLNTGGKPLNNQEIRNCLSKPELQSILREMVNSTEYKNATDFSVKDTRMEAQESALRFMYFYNQYSDEYPIGNYDGYMDRTLDNFVDYMNKQKDGAQYIDRYKQTLRSAYHLFGKQTFRKVYPENINGRRTPVNKLLMLTISVLLTKYNPEDIEAKYDSGYLILPLANIINNNQDFFNAITWSTNSKWNIETAYVILKKDLFDIHLIK